MSVLIAGVLLGADVVVSADTNTAGAEVDVGTAFDLLEAASFSGTSGRTALAGTASAVTMEHLEAAPRHALVVVMAVGAVLQTGGSVSSGDLLHFVVSVVVVSSREGGQR